MYTTHGGSEGMCLVCVNIRNRRQLFVYLFVCFCFFVLIMRMVDYIRDTALREILIFGLGWLLGKTVLWKGGVGFCWRRVLVFI